jgi:hypothetical protein
MRRLFRGVLVLLVVPLLVCAPSGCSKVEEGKPNPDLKVPDVPPGNRGPGKGGPLQGPPGKSQQHQ